MAPRDAAISLQCLQRDTACSCSEEGRNAAAGPSVFTITEKAPTRLKAPTSAFTLKTDAIIIRERQLTNPPAPYDF